jgi:hypothetical protein
MGLLNWKGPSRYNYELYNLYDKLKISKIIKIHRVKLACHIIKMEDIR